MRYAIKKPLLSLAFVLVLLSAIALGGCGSVSNGGASDSPAEESLKPADIGGYWIVSEADGIPLDDTLELGMFSALQFDENGGLKLITHLKDSKVEREGTYEIDGKSLYINIPEAEEQSAGAISISFKAVENAEATIDGDTLTTNGISTKGGETVANKSTDEQYQEYVDRVVALGPKKLAVGETGTTNLRHSPSIHYPTSMKSTLRTPLVFTATILIRMASPTCWQESLTRTSAQSTPCLDMPPKHPSKSLETNTQVRLKSMLDLALGAITASKRKIRQLLLFIVSFPIL